MRERRERCFAKKRDFKEERERVTRRLKWKEKCVLFAKFRRII